MSHAHVASRLLLRCRAEEALTALPLPAQTGARYLTRSLRLRGFQVAPQLVPQAALRLRPFQGLPELPPQTRPTALTRSGRRAALAGLLLPAMAGLLPPTLGRLLLPTLAELLPQTLAGAIPGSKPGRDAVHTMLELACHTGGTISSRPGRRAMQMVLVLLALGAATCGNRSGTGAVHAVLVVLLLLARHAYLKSPGGPADVATVLHSHHPSSQHR